MKNIFFVLTTFVASVSLAKISGGSRTPQALFDDAGSGSNQLYFQLIPYAEDFGFGLAYEKDMGDSLGFGGSLTYLPDDDTAPNVAAGLVSFAGQIRLHHVVKSFDFYVAPGLNLMIMKMKDATTGEDEDDTSIGASVAVGSLVQLGSKFAMGIELSAIQPWFNEDFYGVSRDYYLNSSLTARLTF